MMKLVPLVLLTLFVMLSVQSIAAVDVPPLAPGFTWQEIPELKAAFLKPNGWFFKREEQKGTLAYFITKENIDKNGQFQTGLTVNVFHLKKDPAVERGKYMIAQLATTEGGTTWHVSMSRHRRTFPRNLRGSWRQTWVDSATG